MTVQPSLLSSAQASRVTAAIIATQKIATARFSFLPLANINKSLLGAGDNGVRTTHTTGEHENDWIRHPRC